MIGYDVAKLAYVFLHGHIQSSRSHLMGIPYVCHINLPLALRQLCL